MTKAAILRANKIFLMGSDPIDIGGTLAGIAATKVPVVILHSWYWDWSAQGWGGLPPAALQQLLAGLRALGVTVGLHFSTPANRSLHRDVPWLVQAMLRAKRIAPKLVYCDGAMSDHNPPVDDPETVYAVSSLYPHVLRSIVGDQGVVMGALGLSDFTADAWGTVDQGSRADSPGFLDPISYVQ